MLNLVSAPVPDSEDALLALCEAAMPAPVWLRLRDALLTEARAQVHDELEALHEEELEEWREKGYQAALTKARDESARLLADLEAEAEHQHRADRAQARAQAREAVEGELADLAARIAQAESRERALVQALETILGLMMPLGRSVPIGRLVEVLRLAPDAPLDLDQLNAIGQAYGWRIHPREAASGQLALQCRIGEEELAIARLRRIPCAGEAVQREVPLALPAPDDLNASVLAD